MIILGIISTAVVYFLFKKGFEDVFANANLVGAAFLVTAAFLAVVSFTRQGGMSEGDLRPWHALLIGVAQGIAITPGISRSGITICAALLIGLRAPSAFRFSFLLSIPTIIIAWVYDALSNPGGLSELGGDAGPLTVGFVVAFASAIIAVYLLKEAVLSRRLWWFSIYLLPAGIFTLLYVK
jgi:undecaprenyl-diphosphatase